MTDVKTLPTLCFSADDEKKQLTAVVVAAGNSVRMGKDKLLMNLCGKPVILHTLNAFQGSVCVAKIVVVANENNICEIQKICSENNISKLSDIVLGGDTRLDSVSNGISRCTTEYVAIHDGARPLVTSEIIEKVFEEAVKFGAAAAGAPVKNTLKTVNESGVVINTPDRKFIFEAHTPQIFSLDKYLLALSIAKNDPSRE
ncbi:MAG: 2-C-methyl-D-erythritol 4-phosphate cytidylyltransferase, partial [Acutalibacteraceae bacterium]